MNDIWHDSTETRLGSRAQEPNGEQMGVADWAFTGEAQDRDQRTLPLRDQDFGDLQRGLERHDMQTSLRCAALEPREGWVQLSWEGWDTTPKLYLKLDALTATVSSPLRRTTRELRLLAEVLHRLWEVRVRGRVLGRAEEGYPQPPRRGQDAWGNLPATATGWITGSGGNIVTMALRSDYVDVIGEYA